MKYRKHRAAGRRVIRIQVSEAYDVVPIRVEVVPATSHAECVLPAAVCRLQCGPDAPRRAERAPLTGRIAGA